MKNTNYILHKFFVRRQFLIFDDYYLYIKRVAESLKPVKAEADKSILVRYENHLDLVFPSLRLEADSISFGCSSNHFHIL